ncbi:MAG: carboxypeptidase regulatory-like domain-containing protein [Trueperaceae bacterium]|nr:carboxypeptidase regulatory-like domain-containing protein [Trueperaceae bacterium]
MRNRDAWGVLNATTRRSHSGASLAITFATLLLLLVACSDRSVAPTEAVSPPPDPDASVSLAGTVIDASGLPRGLVEVTLYPTGHRPGADAAPPIAQTLTDDDGDFSVSDVPAGHYNVFARLGDRGAMIERILIDAVPQASRLSPRSLLELEHLGTIRGTVAAADGQLVVGATVYLAGSPYYAITDGVGAYTIAPVAAGAYDIGAWADGFVDAAYLGVESAPDLVIDVEVLELTSIDEPDAFDPGAPVGEWVDVPTYLDYRVYGTDAWTSATGFARLQPLDMGRAIHTVELDTLQPGMEYEFRLPYDPAVAYPVVLDDPTTTMTIHWQTRGALHEFQPRPATDEWLFRFRTFPDQLSDVPVRIAFGGDIKQSAQPLEMYAEVLTAYTSQDLHALVITGDWVYDDNEPFKVPYWGDNRFADLWDSYKLHGSDSEGRLTPILPGIGNHEVAGGYRGQQYDWDTATLGDNTVFAVQFPTVPSGWYFVVDIGEYAAIVMLDSEHVNPAIGFSQDAQTPWLEGVLEDRADVPDIFVTYHVAAYPVARSFSGDIPRRIRTSWHPLFDAHDAIKLVFEMHDHVYGESRWIRGGKVVAEGAGIKYLGAGHMGTIQNRGFWNPATTWYLEDAMGLYVKQAESGEEHPDDGVKMDDSGDRSRHVWIVELLADERRVRSFMIDGSERTSFTF